MAFRYFVATQRGLSKGPSAFCLNGIHQLVELSIHLLRKVLPAFSFQPQAVAFGSIRSLYEVL